MDASHGDRQTPPPRLNLGGPRLSPCSTALARCGSCPSPKKAESGFCSARRVFQLVSWLRTQPDVRKPKKNRSLLPHLLYPGFLHCQWGLPTPVAHFPHLLSSFLSAFTVPSHLSAGCGFPGATQLPPPSFPMLTPWSALL